MSVDSSSNSSLHPSFEDCATLRKSIPVYVAICISCLLLLLPLFILVLYVGCQRQRRQRSAATAGPMTSHSDVFTFNMAVLELIGVLGFCLNLFGAYANQPDVRRVGSFMATITVPGECLFHLLTCVERYLAVVHPVTYLGLKQTGGVRIRNGIIVCVWLLCWGLSALSGFSYGFFTTSTLVLLVFSTIVVSYCSLTALYILIRPGPGEVGGKRERVDQSKQRAFHTMMAVAGALMLRFLGSLVPTLTLFSPDLSNTDKCLVILSAAWFCLPSSLVLPLLFLHRAGKLPGRKHNTQAG
ncbi:uncharacterized protein LOC115589203 [Sparus aurata]|uniref:uncharacterized protein LOC115589203 n=1 Tax=Sparus aurata TaxID=8175 RepID=UPI0011C18738|nr:uncharacterized protein LOC115589203 [Sparus aurata]